MNNKNGLMVHLKMVSEKIETWPAWKKEALGNKKSIKDREFNNRFNSTQRSAEQGVKSPFDHLLSVSGI